MPDYVLTENDGIPESEGERWEADIAAIRITRDLEDSVRNATPEEQRTLARCSGFGDSGFGDSGFQQGFNPRAYDRAWKERGDVLRVY